MGLRFYNQDGSRGNLRGRFVSPVAYYTNFSEFETGLFPTGWTSRYTGGSNTYTVEEDDGGKHLRFVGSSAGTRGITIDALNGISNDMECTVKFRAVSTAQNSPAMTPLLRGQQSGVSFYLLGNPIVWSSFLGNWVQFKRASRYINGSPTSLVNEQFDTTLTGFDATSSFYYQKSQIVGNTLRSKYWLEGEEEPEDWWFTVTDSQWETGIYYGIGTTTSSDYKVYEIEYRTI